MESGNYVSIWSNERTKQGDDRGNVTCYSCTEFSVGWLDSYSFFFGLRFCSGRRVNQRSEIGDILSKGPFWDVVNLSSRLSSNSSDSNGKMVLTMNTF